MRRSSNVRLTLLPWLASVAVAPVQVGCLEFWDAPVTDASEATEWSPIYPSDAAAPVGANEPAEPEAAAPDVDDGAASAARRVVDLGPCKPDFACMDAPAFIDEGEPELDVTRGGFGGYLGLGGG